MKQEVKDARNKHNALKMSPTFFKEKRDEMIKAIVKRDAPDWGGFKITFFDYGFN